MLIDFGLVLIGDIWFQRYSYEKFRKNPSIFVKYVGSVQNIKLICLGTFCINEM